MPDSLDARDRQTRSVSRSRQRPALYEIAERDDRHLLKDIGVSREEVFCEAGKRF